MSDDDRGNVLMLPSSRMQPTRSPHGLHELGVGRMARDIGVSDNHLNGHWCSHCQGVWYGLMLESECPVCGNRRG